MGRSDTLVTVVMPVFNGLPWLEETVLSVAAQRGVRVQRIAVDDGSTDGSTDLLRRHGWKVLSTDRVGPNVARALACADAEGDLIAFLDQDDLWHPDHLGVAAGTLEAMPSATTAVAPRIPFFGRSRPRLGGLRHGPPTFDPWAVYPVSLIDTPSMAVVRRAALEAVGGWPEDRPLGSDPLLWWRLSVEGPLAVMPRRTVGVRRSERSLSAVSRGRPLDYLDHLRIAAIDALARVPVGVGPGFGANGDRILAAVTGIVAAVIDHGDVTPAARDLEAALSESCDATVVATVGFCGWLVTPHLRRPPSAGSDPVATVIDTWPATASRTRTAALRMVAAAAGPLRTTGLALRSPCSSRRVAVAAAAFAFAGATRLGRVADPLDLRFDTRPQVRRVEASP